MASPGGPAQRHHRGPWYTESVLCIIASLVPPVRLRRLTLGIGWVAVLVIASACDNSEEICECWTSASCSEGVVTLYVPSCVCGEPTRVIENAYQCERGCRTDDYFGFDGPAREACEEWRPKEVDDPCTSRRDCVPSAHGTYLDCDLDSDRCVDVEPPVVPDYLAQCGVTGDDVKLPDDWFYGFVPSQGCDSGLCLVAGRGTCVAQGCTIACEFNQDCPVDSVCTPRRDWSPFKLRFEERTVCVYEPRDFVGDGLECPAE